MIIYLNWDDSIALYGHATAGSSADDHLKVRHEVR